METMNSMRFIEKYTAEVLEALYEPVIERELGATIIDPLKALFLLLPLLNDEEWSQSTYKAAVAVGAVHAAFDAHDAVHLKDASSTKQQLMVLAGDHFSGIYYRLLASSSDFMFIRSLSSTIGQINELKTQLHLEQLSLTVDLIHHLEIIEAGCIVQFYRTYGYSRYIPIVEIALPLVKLQQEIGKWTSAVKEPVPIMYVQAVKTLTEQWNDMLPKVTFIKSELVDDLSQLILSSSNNIS